MASGAHGSMGKTPPILEEFPAALEAVPQAGTRPGQPALDRPGGHAHHAGDFFVRVSLDIGQNRYRAELDREGGQAAFNGSPPLRLQEKTFRGWLARAQPVPSIRLAIFIGIAHLLQGYGRPALPTPKLVVARVGHDAQNPGPKRPAPKAPKIPVG